MRPTPSVSLRCLAHENQHSVKNAAAPTVPRKLTRYSASTCLHAGLGKLGYRWSGNARLQMVRGCGAPAVPWACSHSGP